MMFDTKADGTLAEHEEAARARWDCGTVGLNGQITGLPRGSRGGERVGG